MKASSRVGFLYRRTIGAFGLEIPVSTKALILPDEERTLSILRHIEQTVPLETKWWPVFRSTSTCMPIALRAWAATRPAS